MTLFLDPRVRHEFTVFPSPPAQLELRIEAGAR